VNVEYINPFVQGAQNTINSIYGERPSLGAVKIKQLPYSSSPVAITIEFFGGISGCGIYNMHESLACDIASKMMMGMTVKAFDDMAKSAISELGNMITGGVATMIASKGVPIDIKPPLLVTDASPSISSQILPNEKLISIPLSFASGEIFVIDLLLREQ
jgi:chemotaxis protein CheX